jgi:DNA repair protein RadA/Sms
MVIRRRLECGECGMTVPKWVGQCPGCGAWNAIVAVEPSSVRAPAGVALPITEVAVTGGVGRPTGLAEVDRVLGGGLLPGSVTLLGGEPGIGKSTLLLQWAASVAMSGRPVLYVSAEESAVQVRQRAERVEALVGGVYLVAEHDVRAVLAHVDALDPAMVVVDSVQTVADPEVGSPPGSVLQVRAVAEAFVRRARESGPAIVLVGQVTKDGGLAGPRALEHVVDTVLHFEGDRHQRLRLLRAVKHRFGATGELGLFEMTGTGLVGVADPSALFLEDRQPSNAGSAVVPVIEGGRPLLIELQALLVSGVAGSPRRTTRGLDSGRLQLLLAVLDRRVGISLVGTDVYASAVGGIRVTEPGADLGLLLAVASAATDTALSPQLVACGEVGLGGEVRKVAQIDRRLAEAARLGFTWAVVPSSVDAGPPGLRLLPVADVGHAAAVSGLTGDDVAMLPSARGAA